jgi:cytochrome c oxidase cbb3-type subunit I/II
MFVLTYNVIRTVRANAKVEDELAEAPELQKLAVVELKGEVPPLVREKTNSVDHIGYNILIGVIQIVPTIMVKSIQLLQVLAIYAIRIRRVIIHP